MDYVGLFKKLTKYLRTKKEPVAVDAVEVAIKKLGSDRNRLAAELEEERNRTQKYFAGEKLRNQAQAQNHAIDREMARFEGEVGAFQRVRFQPWTVLYFGPLELRMPAPYAAWSMPATGKIAPGCFSAEIRLGKRKVPASVRQIASPYVFGRTIGTLERPGEPYLPHTVRRADYLSPEDIAFQIFSSYSQFYAIPNDFQSAGHPKDWRDLHGLVAIEGTWEWVQERLDGHRRDLVITFGAGAKRRDHQMVPLLHLLNFAIKGMGRDSLTAAIQRFDARAPKEATEGQSDGQN